MEDCIFCKIASGEIQGLRIYENEETLAFMDIAKDTTHKNTSAGRKFQHC